MEIGVQTRNAVNDRDPLAGFLMLKEAGFSCADFSLNSYLKNKDLYQSELNRFFDRPLPELKDFFSTHKKAAKEAGIRIHQMHMPYPAFVPGAKKGINEYLRDVMAPKSMEICAFFDCRYIVVHGFKLTRYYGSEEAEWEKTEDFLENLAPLAKEYGITICMENLYTGLGGHLVEGPGCNADKAVQRIDRMNEKYGAEVLGFCFDTGHANLVGLDFERFIGKLGHRLKVLHIHDNDGIADLHQIPFTFSRTRDNLPATDWEGFLRGLKAVDFGGVLNFETSPVLESFPEPMWPKALSLIAEIGEYFCKELAKR